MREGAMFFRKLLEVEIPRVCIENPIMHKYGREIVGPKYTQIIQPFQFGHEETKATCLWLKGLPPLTPTDIRQRREARVHKMGPSPSRSRERSRFFRGIAEAMINQWANPKLR